jgi:hypothetical protein
MSADLISKWRRGNLGREIKSIEQAEEVLGEVLFVDEWRYVIDDLTVLAVRFDEHGQTTGASITGR